MTAASAALRRGAAWRRYSGEQWVCRSTVRATRCAPCLYAGDAVASYPRFITRKTPGQLCVPESISTRQSVEQQLTLFRCSNTAPDMAPQSIETPEVMNRLSQRKTDKRLHCANGGQFGQYVHQLCGKRTLKLIEPLH